MKSILALSTGCALLALSAGAAAADCGDDISSFTKELQTGIASNAGGGSMSGSASASAGGSASTGSGGQMAGIAKDGSTAPLQSAEGSSEMTGSIGGAPSSGSMSTGSTSSGASGTSGSSGAGGGELSKDGSTMPLAEGQGGGDATKAMSGQDVQAQQEGGQTAAQQAGQDGTASASAGGGTTMAASDAQQSETVVGALDRARAANVRGDEGGCIAALDEARSLQGRM